jgi:hypothetical protein
MTWHGGAGRPHQHSRDARHHSQAHMLAAHMSMLIRSNVGTGVMGHAVSRQAKGTAGEQRASKSTAGRQERPQDTIT